MLDLIEQAMDFLDNLKSDDNRFNFPYPVCWFGNLKTHKPIILTFGINPSNKEFEKDHIIVMGNDEITPEALQEAYNNYFTSKPYKRWFNPHNSLFAYIDASYYDDDSKYQLVHVDLFPFASNPVWNEIKADLPDCKQQMFDIGKQILEAIITRYDVRLIVSFGGLDEKLRTLQKWEMIPEDLSKNQIPQKDNARCIVESKLRAGGRELPIILSSAVVAYKNKIVGFDEHISKIMQSSQDNLHMSSAQSNL